MMWKGNATQMRDKKNVYKNLLGKPENERPFGRLRHTWGDTIT
jgi:hypothetical protein